MGGAAVSTGNRGLKKDRRTRAKIEKNTPKNGIRFLLARKYKFVVSFCKKNALYNFLPQN